VICIVNFKTFSTLIKSAFVGLLVYELYGHQNARYNYKKKNTKFSLTIVT